MGDQRRQSTLFQENSTTVVTRLAAELKERYEQAQGEELVSEDALEEEAEEKKVDMRPLPGVQMPQRMLRVVSESPEPLPTTLSKSAAPAPAPSKLPIAGSVRRSSDSAIRRPADFAKGQPLDEHSPALNQTSEALTPVALPPDALAPRRRSSAEIRTMSAAPEPPGSTPGSRFSSRWATVPMPTENSEPSATPQETEGTTEKATEGNAAPPPPKALSAPMVAALALAAVVVLGFIGQQLLQRNHRPAVMAETAAQVGNPASGITGVALPSASGDAAPAPSTCLNDHAQTISSNERDQLLLDAVLAVDNGKQKQAQELFQRYVNEACDGATLEALALLKQKLAAAKKEGSP